MKEQEDDEWKKIEDDDDNMLVQLERPQLKRDFLDYLQNHTPIFAGIVSHHLSLQQHQQCMVANSFEWLYGDFNVCIPISVSNWQAQRLMIRCPFPHMFGGLRTTDNIDEKIRCEAATFAWISQNCDDVPIPRLWGFGLPGGLCFTSATQLPWHLRTLEHVKQLWAWLRRRSRCVPFVPRQSPFSLKSGYLLVDYIDKEQGTMLSERWPPESNEQRRTFYKSLSRVILDLAKCPLGRIGSFTIHNSGEMSLSNRPLTLRLPLLENEGIPTNIPRSRCYSTTDSYLHDLLNCHDQKLRYQPNAIRTENDARAQMAVLTTMRTLASQFTQRQLQRGPFVFMLTDLHASNIFVDQKYNISSIIDLEWGCSLPIETQHPPFWLSGHDLDDLEGEIKEDFDKMCDEFLEIFEEEDTFGSRHSLLGHGFCKTVMRDALRKKTHWFWSSLNEPRGMYNLFLEHIQPLFAPSHSKEEAAIMFQDSISPYWTLDASDFINRKLNDRKCYLDELRSKYRIRGS